MYPGTVWGKVLKIESIPEKVEQWKKTETEKGIFIPDSE